MLLWQVMAYRLNIFTSKNFQLMRDFKQPLPLISSPPSSSKVTTLVFHLQSFLFAKSDDRARHHWRPHWAGWQNNNVDLIEPVGHKKLLQIRLLISVLRNPIHISKHSTSKNSLVWSEWHLFNGSAFCQHCALFRRQILRINFFSPDGIFHSQYFFPISWRIISCLSPASEAL